MIEMKRRRNTIVIGLKVWLATLNQINEKAQKTIAIVTARYFLILSPDDNLVI